MNSSRRILVVDDERIVNEDISECLRAMGCEVVGNAINGAQAIELARQHRPDLIMMDITLQGDMDGTQAAAIIRQELSIPCVYLTAYSDPDVLERAKGSEPAGYIVKPFEEASLRSTVEIALHRCELERQLKENHDWLATILMSIGDGVIVTDDQGAVRFMNGVAENLTGWPTDRVIGHMIDRVFPVYDITTRQQVPNPASSALRGESSASPTINHVLLRADGKTIAIDHTSSLVRDANGAIAGVVLVFRDVTLSRQAADLLRRNQAELENQVKERTEELTRVNESLNYRVQLEELVSNATSQLAVVERDKFDDTVEKVLHKIADTFQLSAATILASTTPGAPLALLAAWKIPVVEDLQLGPLLSDLPTEKAQTDSYIWPGCENLPIIERYTAQRPAPTILFVPLTGSSQVRGWLILQSKNVRTWSNAERYYLTSLASTYAGILSHHAAEQEKLRLQEQLTRSQRMEAVGRLSGGIAHDFNNTLLPIIGYADVLLHRLPPDDPNLNELQEIRRAAKHAASLTRQLLAFSRKQIVSKVVFDLNEEITSMRKMLERIIGENIKLDTKLTADLPRILADAGQIQQIIMNLVVNARDAMPQGGQLTITTSLVPRSEVPALPDSDDHHTEHYLRLIVSDTGTGIPKEIRDRIFDPFFSTKGAEGTGLGLSVIYSIIENHQGTISVESEVGQGTTFLIHLPVPREGTAGAPAKAVSSRIPINASSQGERILLVEDEIAVRKFVTQALTMHGYKVFPAECLAEARKVYESEKGEFHMIFTDAILPDGNGVELLSELLSRQPTLKALLSSGYTDKQALLELAEEKEIAFLQKPYSLPDLLKMVRNVLEGTGGSVLN